jgi:predicted acyltransferase
MATDVISSQGITERPARTELPAATSPRLQSLDALRGFDMFWIIGGQGIVLGLAKAWPGKPASAVVAQLHHVRWQGLHFYDVIWPLFMFMVGVSLSFSLAKRKAGGASNKALVWHAARRAAVLFFMGMVAQCNLLQFSFSSLHPCYSVLHGIAAGYFLATLLALNLRPVGQAIATGGLLVAYWILLLTIPVPNAGRGVLTPTGNAATYIDGLILGRFSYVPAGSENTWFLSYLGFASSVMIGVLAGELLLSDRAGRRKCWILGAYGAGLVLLGAVWSAFLPVIKLLWDSSFVLISGGISCLMMVAFYLVIDVLGYRKWAFPFSVIGMNALAVYMATELFDFRKLGNIFVGHLLPRVGRWDQLVSESAAFVIIWLILYWMYRTRSFVKL